MDTGKAGLIICLTLVIVVGINGFLYAMLTRKNNTIGQIELMRKAANRFKDPWKPEDDALKELSERVKHFKKDQDQEP